MERYIDTNKIIYSWTIDADGTEHDGVTLQSVIDKIPTADVLSIEEAAELLGRLEPTPCELKGNEWLQEICDHKDTCADTSDKDCWVQYLKYRNKKPVTDCHDSEDKANLVKVVRCKDCRFSSKFESLGTYVCLKDYGTTHKEDDFCNKGKLKKRKERTNAEN